MNEEPLNDAAALIIGEPLLNVTCRAIANVSERKVQFSDGWFELLGDAHGGETEFLGVFQLGTGAETAAIDGVASSIKILERAIDALRTLAEKRLRARLASGELMLTGRVNNPAGSTTVIDAVTFESYLIEDWKRGIARTSDGSHRLYSLHVGAPSNDTQKFMTEDRSSVQAVSQAINALWGTIDAVPPMPVNVREKQIIEWLIEDRNYRPSNKTVQRAWKDLGQS